MHACMQVACIHGQTTNPPQRVRASRPEGRNNSEHCLAAVRGSTLVPTHLVPTLEVSKVPRWKKTLDGLKAEIPAGENLGTQSLWTRAAPLKGIHTHQQTSAPRTPGVSAGAVQGELFCRVLLFLHHTGLCRTGLRPLSPRHAVAGIHNENRVCRRQQGSGRHTDQVEKQYGMRTKHANEFSVQQECTMQAGEGEPSACEHKSKKNMHEHFCCTGRTAGALCTVTNVKRGPQQGGKHHV
jgi:hypothetical protein